MISMLINLNIIIYILIIYSNIIYSYILDMGIFTNIINSETFDNISNMIPFLMFLIIVLISILGGMVLLSVFYFLIKMIHISISITNIVIGFIFILGIMIIVLLSTKKEHFLGMPNVIDQNNKYKYTMKDFPNQRFVKNNRAILADGTPCIAIGKNNKHYLTSAKYGICGDFKSKYGDRIDSGEDGIIYGGAGGNGGSNNVNGTAGGNAGQWKGGAGGKGRPAILGSGIEIAVSGNIDGGIG